MTRLDDPLHDAEIGSRDSTLDTTRIDDVRIGAVRPLITPALLQERAAGARRHAGAGGAQPRRDRRRAARRATTGWSWWWARARSTTTTRRSSTRSACKARGRRAAGRPADRDARLLREAAHHGGLEGLHQRPAPRRQLRASTRACERARRLLLEMTDAGPARRHRVPRPAHPAVHRRPGRLGRHRRAHHREPEPSPARLGPELPGRLQERHRRQRQGRGRRDARRAARRTPSWA